MGFFGESQGFSTAVVNAHIRKVLDTFAAIPDKSKVDRVAMGYLGPDSQVAKSFAIKLRTNEPFSRFPLAHTKVRGHATALLVSRRNEGDHRSLSMLARTMPNASAVLLMARLRRPQLNDRLKHTEFVTFLEKKWGCVGRILQLPSCLLIGFHFGSTTSSAFMKGSTCVCV